MENKTKSRIEKRVGMKNAKDKPWSLPDSSSSSSFFSLFFSLLLGAGCTNSLLGRLSGTLSSTVPTPTSTSSTTPTDLYIISSVTINAGSGSSPNPTASGTPSGTGATGTTNLFFDTTKSTAAVSAHCNVATAGQTSKPCLCQFTWSEINPNSSSNVATSRKVQTAVTQVQPNLLTCSTPSVYASEIINGTQIKITVLPGPNNSDATNFSTTPFLYTKSSTAVGGSFQDAQGQIFDNIVHYSCYNKYLRGLSIQSKTHTITNSSSGEISKALYATSFCLTAGGGNPTGSADCPSLGAASNSAQSYYFNLYIRNSEKGDINKFNDGFICPTVQEPLTGSTTAIGSPGQFWPMDATFALSLGATADFSIGVQANTKLSGGSGDPTTAASQCFPTATGGSGGGGGSTNSVISSCLGFAAPTSTDGTCPNLRSASGQILQTFRLRRFVALYPRLFDTDGKPAPQAQAIDTVYVLDRPLATSITVNPLKPYTMLGPKPCPFAFFDKKDVAVNKTGGFINTPLGYRATNDSRWKTGDGTINYTQSWTKGLLADNNGGTNIDGLEFPNFDNDEDTRGHSCSAAIPFLSSDNSRFYIATVNKFRSSLAASTNPAKFNHLYIRPFQPFAPHYEEDTEFLACAPQANPFKDPPLHFMPSSSGTNYAWCAESYPTQNPNISTLDPAVTGALATPKNLVYPATDPAAPLVRGGLVSPYTSHLSIQNGVLATGAPLTACTASPITIPTTSYTYPGFGLVAGATWGYAKHSAATTWEPTVAGGTADKTCDRTVLATSDVSWSQYPLLAPAADVQAALASDSSYNCAITYDNATGKAALRQSPSESCCVLTSSRTPITGATHLEPSVGTPDKVCLPPKY